MASIGQKSWEERAVCSEAINVRTGGERTERIVGKVFCGETIRFVSRFWSFRVEKNRSQGIKTGLGG